MTDGPPPVTIMRILGGGAFLASAFAACAASVPAEAPDLAFGKTVVFGRIVTVLTAPSSRPYEPKVAFFEMMNRGTGARTQVKVDSDDRLFILQLTAGDYEVTRVQIHEGPFTAMADLALAFHIGQERLAYLGTWRIGVDRPRNDRHLLVAVVQNRADQVEAERHLIARHADLADQPIATLLPSPAATDTALYEVMPYPRVVPYFRRHW